ncbi:hypothetical protein GCM10010123_26860 [Pilimelia anulata]|uniref:Type VII secretion protein EccB n=1 Tax=Pilimelia anulata TaxID=53371 RepID=A0A8J3F936_9ACTN|nr:type VII secretion protein EccB [Pilimelia anulata]GGJ95638.1 hypothetical protein GCM10010123_26860 [Pilimelia anulata]
MATRQEQLDAYRFAVGRVVAALLLREPDPARSPLRRAAGAVLAGLLVAALGVAVAAVAGVVAGGGQRDWRAPNAVLLVKETGARYVHRDGRLYPVANLGSALLLGDGAAPRRVAAATLTGVPRGLPVGIPGAPDALPARRALLTGPWAVCALPGDRPRALLYAGRPPAGGTPAGDGGVLVSAGGAEYLVWQQRRHRLLRPDTVRAALGWTGAPAAAVPAAFVNALGAGPDLDGRPLPGTGRPVRALRGARVGDVYLVPGRAGGVDQYAVAVPGGLAPLTPVQASLLLAAADRGDGAPRPLTPAAYAAAPRRPPLSPPGTGPASAPRLAAAGTLCALVPDERGAAEVRLAVPGVDPAAGVSAGPGGVSRVVLPPGGGVLARSAPAPGVDGALLLVTDLGRRYAVVDDRAQRALGYGGVAPVRLPAALVALLPAGPALDPAAAARTLAPGS